MPTFKYIRSLTLVSLATFIAGCTSSPTGRNQLLLFSDSQMNTLGTQSFDELKQKQTIETDPTINRYVQCVANSVTASVPKEGFDAWEVVVFKSDEINAFALPGGKIGVYTGLLKVAKNEDQLATVIGHEVAHVLAEHGNERMSQSQLANTGIQLTSVVIGASQYAQYQQLAMGALGVGVQYGVLLPYSRKQESEADMIGVELMNKAGFDANQSIALWKNMAAASNGNQPPELLSTHPSNQTRIRDLTAEVSQLGKSNQSRPQCGI
ncbi:M48 family metallopeptidase [Vibrio viridaestus]|uniref:M48 family peptidase n=1 Tax=Vibrio viridaestus TaxID=2487322 RepID=A0A3N9TJX9_9VIBR|nr:M48 family metallopeptidase [Vibrio viridaestus]RQW64481.1 M48 family peptidase [Vibrio viridaestus]